MRLLITPDCPRKGHAQIRSLFEKAFANISPPNSTSLNLAKPILEGELAYILWSGSSALYNAAFCTEA